MIPDAPFVDRGTGDLDMSEIVAEAIPIAKLVALFVTVALVPYALVFGIFGGSMVGALLGLLGQFVLTVGAGVVMIYVVARGVTLADGE